MSDYVFDAECSLAGCILCDGSSTFKQIQGIVNAGDFLSTDAAAIYSAAAALLRDSRDCDPVLIQKEAAEQGVPLSNEYCAQVMRLYVTTANAAETARVVHDAAQKRKARAIGLSLAEDGITPVDALMRLQELLMAQSSKIHSPMEAARTVTDYISAAASGKAKPFLSTGYPSLDKKLSGGLAAGGLITVAARPGTGKTTVALNIAENVARAGGKVLYISLEMTEAQLWACRAANISGMNRSTIYGGGIVEEDWPKLKTAFDILAERPFLIRDLPSTLVDIEREARCSNGLSLVVVDHIGLVKPTEKGSRYELVTAMSHALKQLALSLRVPILMLCQLNRQSELREGKRPTMADLRDSGAIEEDSDVVCLLFRGALYLPPKQQPAPWEKQEIDFIIDKNRHGSTGICTLNFCGQTASITEA